MPAALGVRAADPQCKLVALSGDYDFQFMLEELAVGAQFKLPYIHVVVNNSYLGLIRQAQRGFEMDCCVQLGFDNINTPAAEAVRGYGVDHVKVVEGLGCKAVRVHRQEELRPAIRQAEAWMAEYQVPVVSEVALERVTNIAMGHRDREPERVRGHGGRPRGRPDRARAARLNGRPPMPRLAANLSMLFTEVPFLDRFERAARAGFQGVEFLFPYAHPASEIRARLDWSARPRPAWLPAWCRPRWWPTCATPPIACRRPG